ncbi:MAG: endonuclease MutS2 [Phycisphaerae bacterium]
MTPGCDFLATSRIVNDATFQKLEFDRIRETVASHSSTALGRRLARSLIPATKPDQVRQWLDQARELTGVANTHGLPPMAGVHDIREAVHASGRPTPLEGHDLARIAETLAATGPLTAWFADVGDGAPGLQRLGRRITDHTALASAINDAIDPRGGVRDYASPKLAGIRDAIAQAREEVAAVFGRLLRQSGVSRMLQYRGSTFHNDRGVLPLKAEYRGRIPGIVHRASDSGATLFVEPAESVQINNTIVQLRDREQREITRILTELTHLVHTDADAILAMLRAIAVLDLNVAKVRYATKRDCICPDINDDGVLDLHDARHPVLIELFDRGDMGAHTREHTASAGAGNPTDDRSPGKPPRRDGPHPHVDAGGGAQQHGHGDGERKRVVPIDVRLGDDFDVLVITGPNTGGKTVTVKTVGLLALMTQCGIPIPVGPGSTMPVYRRVFVDIGDEQSLQQSLSTFSSHVSNLLDILRRATPETLVLVDELGAGTDPDEGAAIGSAVVGELLRVGAKALVTTHLSALKAVAYTQPRVDNASVEFDPETLRPTFHVRMGEPGNSNALIIAKRLGMSPRLIAAATEHLDHRQRTLAKAIEGTLQSRRDAEAARKTARDAALAAQRQRDELQREAARLKDEHAAFQRWSAWVNDLQPGDDVFIRTMNRPAKVVRMQLHQQIALVSTGRIDMEVPLRDVEALPDA